MRFGRTLSSAIYPPWRDNYIDYGKLKKLLRDDESAPSSPTRKDEKDTWTEEDEGSFVDELVNVQLEKVHAFHKEMLEKLRERTAGCEAKLDGVAVGDVQAQDQGQDDGAADGEAEGLYKKTATNGNGNGKQPVPSESEKQKILKDTLSELDQITKETNELEKYSRINYTGFLKAAKKHDRKRGASYRVRPLLQVRLAALPFNKEDYSPLLYRLSAMYNFIRQHLNDDEGGAALKRRATGGKGSMGASEMQQQADGKEEYTSHKFWVHPENLLEVKTMILRRLPVLVYNPQTSKIAEGSQPDPSITSIYFDNPAFSLYTRKVEEGVAESMRLRWYGQLNTRPHIWVEKKTVTQNEDMMSEERRFRIKEKYVQSFITNEYHMEKQISKLENRAGSGNVEVEHLKGSVEEIQSFIESNDLQPVLRANYTRTAFQIPGDDRVRISLDTDLAFIREDALDVDRPCRDPETWHRTDIDDNELEYPFSSIRKGEISRFPFALLELKVRSSTNLQKSEWLQDLMNSHLVKAAPRFSKFVHGVASLFEDYVNTFPFWLSEMEVDIRRDPQQAFIEERERKRKEAEDEVAVGSFLRTKSSIGSGMRASARGAADGKGVISPVGSALASPQMSAKLAASASPRTEGKSQKKQTQSNLGQSMVGSQTQQESVVEEVDEDETGSRLHGPSAHEGTTNYGTLTSAFQSILPSTFSTSKYAQHKRAAGRQAKLPPGVTKPEYWIKDQGEIKVEAKVWLANQRTFVKWQHVAVLLGSLSLGLYNAAGEDNNVARALAVVYVLVAIFTGAWGYGVYIWRSRLIEQRSGKDFDAVAGPVVVCVGLCVALVANFGFKYRLVLEERKNGGMVGDITSNKSQWFVAS